MPRGRPRGSGGGMAIDKPRGRMTPYAYFVQTCRSEHKKLHPDEIVQFQEFSRQCSDRWKTMSEMEKKKFQEMAEKANLAHFGVGGGRRARRGRGTKPPKDPNRPKRALSAFFYYANDERPKVRAANPDFSVGEVAKELGRQWNEMTESEKAKYEKQAEEDRARYDREMQIYKLGESPLKKMKASNGHPVPEHDFEDDDEVGPDEDDDEANGTDDE
ncbi:High mobility group box 1 [Halocaridina rubra]|uniref:High mobility group box 1 n=1 Tax=Halocaridina rubra TaxID=373956 RepID=A0AAN8XMP5_HALRR